MKFIFQFSELPEKLTILPNEARLNFLEAFPFISDGSEIKPGVVDGDKDYA